MSGVEAQHEATERAVVLLTLAGVVSNASRAWSSLALLYEARRAPWLASDCLVAAWHAEPADLLLARAFDLALDANDLVRTRRLERWVASVI